ncbi:hypothetical protein DD238_007528 [Peronospora effusa]|uniref:Uncharacterized protein n=1 Tax=Peronospora effusa TaxID=542832 RepID=A0A3M6V7D0_9STRA|nr:hypothetical protein DD238_007528 [Peronospora effusa]RQM16201.1 hypothetical protein DD237_006784 [Peronospora effusa]
MASLGPNDVTMASDMEEQYQEQQEGDRETMQTAEENVSVESTTTTVEEITTFEETPTITTVEEHQISEVFVSTDSISAVAMEEIAETIAARDSVNLDMDYSVAATLGSSMDGESVRTEDFAEEEVFIEEECSKNAEVDFTELAELAAADEAIEAAKTQYSSDKGTETTEDLKQVCATRKIQDSKEISAETEVEMGISVGPALGSLVDVDNVLSLGDMCNTSNVDGMETTDALTRNETLKSTEVPSNGFHAPADSPESASRIPNTAAVEHDHEANISEKVPPKRFSSMLTRFAEKITLKTGPHRTDSAAKLELNSPAPVENIVHHLEEHETVSPQTHRTPSAAKLDLSGSSPVKNVVDRFEAHQNEDNALDSLKIRTKRDFFSEKGRSISVSHEKEKYNTQTAQRAKKEAEAKEQLKSPAKKHSPVYRKSSAMSSVRNMASRFEKKADQSLDNLSFRTVRSFFPTEKSIHVGAEKMKYEALEKENQSAKEAEENFVKHGYHEQRTSSDVATILTDKKEPAAEKFVEEDAVAQITPSMDDMPSTPTKPNETATLKADRTPEPYPRRHTVSTKSDSPNVRGIAYRFETKRANSVVSTPVRTIDTFIVPKSEASVCVSAETAKFETPEKQVRSGKRTIDDFLVPESEASVRVSAEKEKFEKPVKQVKATVRTIDTFIVPDNEASVRVSAEKAKFETPEKLVKAPVRTIDTFIVPDSESSVCVSAEKAKFESPEQQMRLTGPVVRTIDTFIVPESEVSVHVAAEKAKLEALEKQKQCELEAQAAIKKQKSERSMLLASEKAKLEEASQMSEEVKTVEDVAMAHEAEEVEVVGETEVAETTKVTTEAEAVKEIEAIKEPVVVETEAAKVAEVALETKLVPETTVAMQIVAAKTEEIRERDVTADSTTTEEAEVGWEFGVGKNEETDVVEATAVAEQTEVAAGTKKANESEEVDESEGATKRTDEVEEKTAMEVMEMTMVTDVKESEVITSIKEANVTKEVVEIVQENKKAEVDEVFEEIEEVTETEEVSDCGVVKTIEEVLNETTNEEHEVQNWANFSIPAVEVTVERQTFGDIVSTTQHVHWLSLPMSVNPALARLHTVLRDHNPLTAYALYPSNPPSPTSRNK